jgi:hypothetical protein
MLYPVLIFDIDSQKIQGNKDKALTLLSGSENSSISNFKSTIPIHTVLIFKEQAKVKGLREKGFYQTHYSIQHIEGYALLGYKVNKQDLNSSIIEILKKIVLF